MTYGKISDEALDPELILLVNEWSRPVREWREVIKKLDDDGKPFDGLRNKLNQAINKVMP